MRVVIVQFDIIKILSVASRFIEFYYARPTIIHESISSDFSLLLQKTWTFIYSCFFI